MTQFSINAEMKKFSVILKENPEEGKILYENGMQLVAVASNGEFTKFRNMFKDCFPDKLLFYFVVKALQASINAGHLMIASHIIDAGFPLNSPELPNLMIESIKNLTDYECVGIVKFLTSKGFDSNRQEDKTFLSPLHYAVKRSLLHTIKMLIECGSDVNSVGDNDVMPLTIANSLDEKDELKKPILNLLLKNGAKLTWKRGVTFSNTEYSLNQTSTMVSFKGSCETAKITDFEENNDNNSISELTQNLKSAKKSPKSEIEPQAVKMVKFSGGSFNPEDINGSNEIINTPAEISDDGAFLFSTG